jgi:hypothetical protein
MNLTININDLPIDRQKTAKNLMRGGLVKQEGNAITFFCAWDLKTFIQYG